MVTQFRTRRASFEAKRGTILVRASISTSHGKKVNTKGKYLHPPMQRRLAQAIERHRGFLVLIAKEQAMRNGIPVGFRNGRPDGWLADLHAAGIYGMARAALAWQEKVRQGLRTTDFNAELKQGARVRVKQMAKKVDRLQLIKNGRSSKAIHKASFSRFSTNI